MNLSRQQLQAIRTLIRSHQQERQYNAVWRSIHETYGLGTVTGRKIQFGSPDIRRLQQLVERDTGLNLMTDDLSGNRVELAGRTANEKLSGQAVFSDLIWVRAPTHGLLRISDADVVTPPSSILAVSGDVELSKDVPLIVVENGIVFRYFNHYALPESLRSAVIIYRGHGLHARYVLDLIQREKGRRKVVGFFDFDPAGLCLSLDTGVSYILIPRLWRDPLDQHKMKPFNKTCEFVSQQATLKARAEAYTGTFKTIADAMLKQGWSLTQEHIMAHTLEMEICMVDDHAC
ncbi:hypothetical protein GCM10023116_32490 [Kistimonas scapharcae]|uniref:DUF7281 domain-containing protein n=1 Tax=Kistimonas scapharcae TaxID=1036133 RepID=A0ABP8V4Y7_9GAMM